MTPLVDVLLLVIFMIAAPVMSKAIPDTMPQRAPFDPPMTVLEPATLRIDAAGSLSIEGCAESGRRSRRGTAGPRRRTGVAAAAAVDRCR